MNCCVWCGKRHTPDCVTADLRTEVERLRKQIQGLAESNLKLRAENDTLRQTIGLLKEIQ